MEVKIREAVRSDLEAILGLYAELDDGQSLDLCDAESVFERMQSYPDYTVYVAELEGEVVGVFELLIMDNIAHLGAPSGVVEDVVVGSQWQRQGIGKAMMRYAIQQCRKAGCYKLTLSSNLKRKSAHTFYESLGFQKHGYSFLISLSK
jgi:ribosomal protein S18 acetylase RimI-like enzyme